MNGGMPNFMPKTNIVFSNGAKIKLAVESDLDDASQTYKFEKIGNVSPIDFSGRTVNLQQYEVRVLKPNDKLNEKKENE